MSWSIVYTAQALQDKRQFVEQGFGAELEQILFSLRTKPTDGIELVGDLSGAWSKTIVAQHCIVYQLLSEQNIVKVVCIT